eukprot:NODE_492_length_7766_cov_0.167210.p3 type:complete len:178 gc:universal NODE_492_length_7766_cov_0.167210:1012-1545(+)
MLNTNCCDKQMVNAQEKYKIQFKCACGKQSKDSSRFTRHIRICERVHSFDKMILNLYNHKSFKSSSMKIQFPPIVTWNRTFWKLADFENVKFEPHVLKLWKNSSSCQCGFEMEGAFKTVRHVYICEEYSIDDKIKFVEKLKNKSRKLVFPRPLLVDRSRCPTEVFTEHIYDTILDNK